MSSICIIRRLSLSSLDSQVQLMVVPDWSREVMFRIWFERRPGFFVEFPGAYDQDADDHQGQNQSGGNGKRAVSCRRSCLIMGPSDFQAVSDSVDRLNLGQGSYGFEATSQKIDIVVQIPVLHI